MAVSTFAKTLQDSAGRIMTLDPSRLLLSLKQPFNQTTRHWRRTALEEVAKLLHGTGLELEAEHYGGGGSAVHPREMINHTERRFWVRAQDGSCITSKSFQALEKKKNNWLEWYAPVYRLSNTHRRSGLVCPLPDVLVVPTKLVRDTYVCNQQAASQRLAHYTLERTQEDEHEQEGLDLKNDYRCYKVKEPNRRNSYQISQDLQKCETKWGGRASFALMPMIDPRAQFPNGPPNDEYYPAQWNLAKINAEGAWRITRGIPDIIVAVIDDGCDFSHPEFARDNQVRAALVNGATYDADGQVANGTGDSQNFPSQTHGTECAGIIGAQINNGNASGMGGTIAGLAPGCRILPIRLQGGMRPDLLGAAIKFAATYQQGQAKVKVISISLASPAYKSDEVAEALALAHRKGVVVCCASGNENGSALEYPAAYARENVIDQPRVNSVIACGACNNDNERCDDWGSGAGSNFGEGLSVVAPGDQIFTLTNDDGRPGGRCIFNFGGTSAAAPHVAGLAALLFSLDNTLTTDEVLDIIEQTAQQINDRQQDPRNLYDYDTHPKVSRHRGKGWNEQVGYGLIDVSAAVQRVNTRVVGRGGGSGTGSSSPPP